MKRRLALILSLVLLIGICAAIPALGEADAAAMPPLPPHVKDGIDVVAVFACAEAQPVALPAGPDSQEGSAKVDTLWIYYSDNTFDQYAEGPRGYELFSTGTYTLKDGGDFILSEDGDNGTIVIERNRKRSPEAQALTEYSSVHEYALGTLGFEQLYSPADEGKAVEAIFGVDHMLTYTDESGVTALLDTVLIFFKDMSFRAFSFVKDDVVLTGSGTYEFNETGDFHIVPFEDDNGTITMRFDESIQGEAPATVTFDLEPLQSGCFYVLKPADAP